MRCDNCGNYIHEGEKFCRKCGKMADDRNGLKTGERICINRDPDLYTDDITNKDDRSEAVYTKFNNDFVKKIVIAAVSAILIIIIVSVYFVIRNNNSKDSADIPVATQAPQITEEAVPAVAEKTPQVTQSIPTATPVIRRGTAEAIPQDVRDMMYGLSYRENNDISLDELSYLTIPYYDFNYQVQMGHMVVNNSVAEEVLDIFAELFDIKYPIERMELVDNYNADDYESIEYNNTSAFNYRPSTSGSGNLSRHGLGLAIDINPQINPYVSSNGTGSHENAREYWSRDISAWTSDIAKEAYIGHDTEIYRIFTSRGWTWGGDWSSYRDYQHFEK